LKGFVSNNEEDSKFNDIAFLLDLVCHRYPSRRPSDYIKLDEWTGFKFDSAIALKYYFQDEERKNDIVSVILDGIGNVCRGLGMKVSKSVRKPLINKKEEPKSLDQILYELGGKGVVIEDRRTKK
jgi:hypothetical protein